MHIARTIFVLFLALSVAFLPGTHAFASVAKDGGIVASGLTGDCHHDRTHHEHKKSVDDLGCIAACGGMCWGFASAGAAATLFTSFVGTRISPVVSDDAVGPHAAAPPFRPPRP